jgi:hypothetical protein
MESDNPVVRLCLDGMRAKDEGRQQDARLLFLKAWDSRTDDYEACVAAYHVAQSEDSVEGQLRWNEEALRRADGVSADRVADFYPSLFLSLARSLEGVGDAGKARRYYELALTRLTEGSEDASGDRVRDTIMQALARLA